ncbi:HPr family phosphocarrier protein [Spirillospora sp. CA-294931]|uniref:HPr family phosphocarrier protein n=1 Tax=Spirillospora sp. CA-294931 TaxID=3240042 RepID=UPI003D8D3E46
MHQRKAIVGAVQGLHARPAQLFVQAAARQPVAVHIRVGDRPRVSASSILAVLTLGATQGTEVTLEAEGEGAEEALDELAALLTNGGPPPNSGIAE